MATGADDPYAAVLKVILDEGLISPTVTYADVAACTIFVWDYLLTMDLEIQLVWKSRWNMIKVVYLLQRYLPFIDGCYLTLYRQMAFGLSVRECELYSYIAAFMYSTGILFSEVLLTSRVWAVWNRDKWLGVIMVIVICCTFAGLYTAMYIYVKGLQYTDFPLPGFNFQGCFIIGANNAVVGSWAALMAWNTFTLVLMLIPGVRAYQNGINTKLTNVIYRDGSYYYLYLFVLSSLNIVFANVLPGQKRVIVTLLERNLHSILASRVLLHMREQLLQPTEPLVSWSTSQARSFDFSAIRSLPNDTENVPLSAISPEHSRKALY